MALNRPFTFSAQAVILAGQINTASFLVGGGQIFDLSSIFVDNVTAGLNLVGIKDSTGLQYDNAGTANPIPLTQLASPAKLNNFNILDYVKPINLIGQIIFIMSIQNSTGGSLTVNCAFRGFLSVQGAGA